MTYFRSPDIHYWLSARWISAIALGPVWPETGHDGYDSRRAAVDAMPDVPRAQARSDGHACAAPAAEAIMPPAEDFLHRWVYGNPALAGREMLVRWLEDPTEREDIAASYGMTLGALLRPFNETAPLSDPFQFM